jgi:transcriptional regulator with XRE-family HTH domain
MESNIKLLRKQHHISQKELGDAIGLSQQLVSRIERDRDKIQIDVLMHLADYFQVSTDCILGYSSKSETPTSMETALMMQAAGGEDRIAEIDKLENMERGQRLLLWNTLIHLKNIL